MPHQRVVLITGCSEREGLGSAVAQAFLDQNFKVFATARKLAVLDHLKEAGCEVVSLDVTNQESLQSAVKVVREKAGRLDILVNNAAQGNYGPLLDTSIAAARTAFDVNVIGILATTQAFSPLLIESRSEKGPKPTVVNIGSIAAIGVPWAGIYASSKAAVHCLSDVMRREMEPLGIKVLVIHLGGVKTATSVRLANEVSPVPASSPYAASWPRLSALLVQDDAKQYANDSWKREDAARDIVKAAIGTRTVVFTAFGWQIFKYLMPFLSYGIIDFIMAKLKHTALAKLPIGKTKSE